MAAAGMEPIRSVNSERSRDNGGTRGCVPSGSIGENSNSAACRKAPPQPSRTSGA